MISPYWNKTFFSFYAELGKRLFSGGEIATDEIQILVLILIALPCALLGGFLQLRKMVMLANSLSHTILLGIVAAFLIFAKGSHDFGSFALSLPILSVAALASAFLTTFLTHFVTKFLKLQEDASIGLIFTSLFSLGIVLVTVFTRNVHLGIEAVMGNPDVLSVSDIQTSLFIAILNFGIFVLFFKKFQIISFDENLAKTLGIRASFYHYLLMALLAATAIAAFRAVGVVLVLAFLVAPFLIARQLFVQLKTQLLAACAISVFSVLLGVGLTRHCLTAFGWALSTGGMVVTILFLFYLFTIFAKLLQKTIRRQLA